MAREPTAAYLETRLTADPDTGILTWRERPAGVGHPSWNARLAGKPAFTAQHSAGYLTGTIDNRAYLAHRVAYALYHGAWPVGHVDHINGDKTDGTADATSATAQASPG